jgi:putative transposase
LEASANDKRHRKLVRHHPPPHGALKGCLSNKTALAMIFKLAEAAEKSWRRLDGHNQLPKVIPGVKFADGFEVVRSQTQAAAA